MIATEIPGQFPGKELYNLDIRDEQFFIKEIRKKQILRESDFLNSVRLAVWADTGSFSRKMNDLQRELDELEGKGDQKTADQKIRETWEDLRMKKRG